jgi:phage shock protein C
MYRIKNEYSKLGGVCQGLAANLNVDVSLVRVLFVVLFFTPIPIFTIYIIMWAVLPKYAMALKTELEPIEINNNYKNANIMSNQSKNGNMIGGLILIVLGAIFSFKTFFDINLFSYIKNVWPLVLIGLGVWIIIKDKDGDNNDNLGGNNIKSGTNY